MKCGECRWYVPTVSEGWGRCWLQHLRQRRRVGRRCWLPIAVFVPADREACNEFTKKEVQNASHRD